MILAKPSRIRRILKWVGLMTCLLILAVWGASLLCCVVYISKFLPVPPAPAPTSTPAGTYVFTANCRAHTLKGGVLSLNSWAGFAPGFSKRWQIIPSLSGTMSRYGFVMPRGTPGGILLPLWVPLLIVGIPTTMLWFFEFKRARQGFRYQCSSGLPNPAIPGIEALEGRTSDDLIQPLPYARIPIRPSRTWKARRERFSRGVSLAIAAVVAAPLLCVVSSAIGWFCIMFWGDSFMLDVGFSETANLVIFMTVSMLVTYAGARILFVILRWRVIESTTPLCANCGCDLGGNESGICPVCGEACEIDAGEAGP